MQNNKIKQGGGGGYKALQGFSLLELLLALMFVVLMSLGIAQYLLVSSGLNLMMQQEDLAARALESLILQASFNSAHQQLVSNALQSLSCPVTAQLDFTLWCQALNSLPDLTVSVGAASISVVWLSPRGMRRLVRPKWN